MAAIQVVTFYVTLGSSDYEAMTPGTGDPSAFAVVPVGTRSWLADVRAVDIASSCEISITAPGFHDQLLGMLGQVPDGSAMSPANRPFTISPPGLDQPIIGGNTPLVNAKGTSGDQIQVTCIIYHSELPGSPQNLMTAQEVRSETRTLLGVDVQADASSGLSQGDWSAPVSIDAASIRLDAARRYALVGFTSDVPCSAVAVTGFETSGLKVGGPVLADGDHDAALILDLADIYQSAIVPVFSGANHANISVYVADPAASTVNLTVQFADLTGPT